MNVTDNINSTTADLIKQFIETSVNAALNDDLIITVFDFITCKLLEFKYIYK